LDEKYGANTSKIESVLSSTVKLSEEVWELSEQVMLWRWRQRDLKWTYNPDDAWAEIADVIISTMMIAYELDIDVEEALEKKILSIKKKLTS
jgi:NTP pyrophosphatase (non-canonical NTP hydrolase)